MAELNLTQKTQFGSTHVEFRKAAGILSHATGFIDAFDFTLNPYNGCGFGCTYCYAAFFATTRELQDNWGRWVQVKDNALELLKKKRRKPLIGVSIYMSSVTDPYQPIEKNLELTRAILAELVEYHQVRLVVQTRGPLVTRDVDLLRKFKAARVNMTVTTDSEEVRRAFEPYCASTQRRLDAIRQVREAGIETCITMTPLLPVADPEGFVRQLLATGAGRFVAQAFHPTKSRFVAGTGQAALAIAEKFDWTPARYEQVVNLLKSQLPNFYEGRPGFTPQEQVSGAIIE